MLRLNSFCGGAFVLVNQTRDSIESNVRKSERPTKPKLSHLISAKQGLRLYVETIDLLVITEEPGSSDNFVHSYAKDSNEWH